MSSHASRAAYRRCPETCQRVRAEIGEAIERQLYVLGADLRSHVISALTTVAFDASLEHGTEKVRNALIECESERIEAGEVIEGLESDLRDSKDAIVELRDELAEVQKELDETRGNSLEYRS